MRRTGIALAAVLYIHAATIKMVSASGVEQRKPPAELGEFAKKAVPTIADNTQTRNQANGVFVLSSIAYQESGIDNFVFPYLITAVKGDGDSLKKRAAVSSLVAMASNGTANQQEKQNIAQRIHPFFAKPLEGSNVSISLSFPGQQPPMGTPLSLGTLDSNGTLSILVEIDKDINARFNVHTTVTCADSTTMSFVSYIWFYSQSGFGVISDIDDTIKVTGILSGQEAIKNTFIKDYTPEDGMIEFFMFLQESLMLSINDVHHFPMFSYIDNNLPGQLQRPLRTFLEGHFPDGELLVGENIGYDRYIKRLTSAPVSPDEDEDKLDVIRFMLRRFPRRKFLLIGDSGERDPEVYGQAYREFPKQITCILIRRVTGVDIKKEAKLNQDKRFVDAFKNVPLKHWDLFDKGSDLTDKVDYQKACRR